jgi:galactose mutarotase-like enzyme
MMNQTETVTLQNDLLRVQILPEFGGKIISLRSIRTEEEFILPPLNGYRHASPTASFSEHDGGGFDECLPSVSGCESVEGEPAVPDHGDLWRVMWQVDSQEDGLVLHADARSRPLRLTRRATLEGSSLILDYDLHNLSDTPTNWLWSAHPLLRVDAGDHVVLPDEVDQVIVEYSASDLFKSNSLITWPKARSTSGVMMDLSNVGEKDGTTANKLFARMDKAGWGALYRNRLGQGLVIRFNPSTLPYLGIWICSGAWPEIGIEKQYTVALEPTTSNVDSLASAQRNGTVRRLNARERCQWRLEFELLGASTSIDLQDFRAGVALPHPIQQL